MNSTLLPSAKLAPQYHLPDPSTSAFFPSHILLGQERVVDTFKLMSKINSQHLFLADFLGVDRPLFINALVTQANTPSNQYLVATKKTHEEDEIQFKWQQTMPPEHVGIIARQESLSCYLQGTIRRADLLGKMLKTDKSSVYKPGALAKNHFVFICLASLWQRESLWDLLMQILHDGFYRINNELAPIPLNCKIVLVGSGLSYSQLRVEDRHFSRHFPLLAEMSNEVDLTQHPESSYVQWLNVLAQSESVELETSSLLPLFWYSSRLVEHQQRLSLSMLEFRHLLGQAKAYCGQSALNAAAIAKALEKLTFRHNSSEVYSAQSFDDNFINLPTKGAMVGQINALTVIDTGDYTYGEPARITSSVHYGDGEVADIERKSELGGNIHAKGMMILSSCLYRIFGRDAPLHLNANIVFEQSYQEIDGDSASLAEYCCLMSAIAEQPIIQSLAVTGALDQFGNVQAIGGVNEKIEGFFNLCQRRGLTGDQGVIMPKANVLQLNLEPDVIEAIDKGLFHIHAIEHMDQAVELLMQMPAGVANEDNDFAPETLYGLVQQRLDKLAGQDDDDVELNFFAKLLARLRII
ncbi:AAA family ATPase [Shewanella vesiculosa]|uniref:AAA family ATPase n=1 Tax=Shewanella vesiculosa TaxID=518738 RepID=UPI003D015E96